MVTDLVETKCYTYTIDANDIAGDVFQISIDEGRNWANTTIQLGNNPSYVTVSDDQLLAYGVDTIDEIKALGIRLNNNLRSEMFILTRYESMLRQSVYTRH